MGVDVSVSIHMSKYGLSYPILKTLFFFLNKDKAEDYL